MKQHPLISIITVNYLQNEIPNLLLFSLSSVYWPNLEIIVVENSYDIYKEPAQDDSYPNVKILRSFQNLGFAVGSNLGLRYASGEYILFLNNDTEVRPDFLKPMINLLQSNHSIGVVSPLIKYMDDPGVIQYAGFNKWNKITQKIRAIGKGEIDNGQYILEQETNFVHGCAMLIRNIVVEGRFKHLWAFLSVLWCNFTFNI